MTPLSSSCVTAAWRSDAGKLSGTCYGTISIGKDRVTLVTSRVGMPKMRRRFRSGAMAPWEFEREGEVPISPWTRLSPAPASSIISKIGFVHISTAAPWNQSLSPGGSPSRGRFSITRDADCYHRRCGRSSISSRRMDTTYRDRAKVICRNPRSSDSGLRSHDLRLRIAGSGARGRSRSFQNDRNPRTP